MSPAPEKCSRLRSMERSRRPLLRRWVKRLRELGVKFQTNHHWAGLGTDNQLIFNLRHDTMWKSHDRIILALRRLLARLVRHWVDLLENQGIKAAPHLCQHRLGSRLAEPILEEVEGLPLKNLELTLVTKSVAAGGHHSLRARGGPIYHLGPQLRSWISLRFIIDFKPDLSTAELVDRLGKINVRPRSPASLEARSRHAALLKLPVAARQKSAEQLAGEVKVRIR